MFEDNENLDLNQNSDKENKPNKDITNELLGEFADLLSEVENENADSGKSFTKEEEIETTFKLFRGVRIGHNCWIRWGHEGGAWTEPT